MTTDKSFKVHQSEGECSNALESSSTENIPPVENASQIESDFSIWNTSLAEKSSEDCYFPGAQSKLQGLQFQFNFINNAPGTEFSRQSLENQVVECQILKPGRYEALVNGFDDGSFVCSISS